MGKGLDGLRLGWAKARMSKGLDGLRLGWAKAWMG